MTNRTNKTNKIEEVKIENIDSLQSGNKTPDYSYWRDEDQLDAQVALRNLSWANSYVWTDTINMTAWTTKSYDIWFKPKKIEINAINTYWASWSIASSVWYSTWDKGHTNYFQYSDWDTIPLTASYDDTIIVWVYRKDSGWTKHYNEYEMISIDTKWFTLNCKTNDQWDNIHIIISCI